MFCVKPTRTSKIVNVQWCTHHTADLCCCNNNDVNNFSSLARALQPSILMMMKLSDGTAHRFEVSLIAIINSKETTSSFILKVQLFVKILKVL